jgi:hypothetical protein
MGVQSKVELNRWSAHLREIEKVFLNYDIREVGVEVATF